MEEKPTEKQLNYAKSLKIESPEKYSRKTLSDMINVKTGGASDTPKDEYKKEEPEVVKPGESPKQAGTSYYTSYAKDIFIAMMEFENPQKVITNEANMADAIRLVKQAREAFE